MPKKKRTPAQLAADKRRSEKMKEAIAKQKEIASTPDNSDSEGNLLKIINDMKAELAELKNRPQQSHGPQVGNQLTGTFEKYIMDPAYYPDPREALKSFMTSKPEYRRFGFNDNYELEWEVVGIKPYERIDHVMETQPRFHLKLIGIVYDEDTYEKTNGRWLVRQMVFFEDPETAISIARDLGLEVPKDKEAEKHFLDEMRLRRMQDWLLEAFFPSKPVQPRTNLRDTVIGGKLVQTWEANSEEPQAVPFDKLAG